MLYIYKKLSPSEENRKNDNRRNKIISEKEKMLIIKGKRPI